MSKNNWIKIKSDYPPTYIPPDEAREDPYWEKMSSLGIETLNLDRRRCYGKPSDISDGSKNSRNITVDGGICGCNLSMMSNNNRSRYRLN